MSGEKEGRGGSVPVGGSFGNKSEDITGSALGAGPFLGIVDSSCSG